MSPYRRESHLSQLCDVVVVNITTFTDCDMSVNCISSSHNYIIIIASWKVKLFKQVTLLVTYDTALKRKPLMDQFKG